MKKPFVVEIEETYRRTVVIYAEDSDDAYETAEELCNSNEIDINANHFSSRNCVCVGEAKEADLRGYEKFDKSGSAGTAPSDSLEGLIIQARELIRDFVADEYGEVADFSDETAIPIAFTDFEDENSELAGIQVCVFVDLPARKIKTYMNGYLVSRRGSDDLEAFVSDLEFCLDFDDLVTITEEEKEAYDAAIVAGNKPDIE